MQPNYFPFLKRWHFNIHRPSAAVEIAGIHASLFTHRVASTAAARGSIPIGRLHFLNGGLHLDSGMLQRSKIIEAQETQKMSRRNNPQLNVFALHLRTAID